VDEDEDKDEGCRVAGDSDGEVEGRMEGRGGIDCISGTNKVLRVIVVNLEPTVVVDTALHC
jgi:hypothetical protein